MLVDVGRLVGVGGYGGYDVGMSCRVLLSVMLGGVMWVGGCGGAPTSEDQNLTGIRQMKFD